MSLHIAKATEFSEPLGDRPLLQVPNSRLAVFICLFMCAVVAGTVFLGKEVAFASIPFLIAAVILLSLNRPVVALTFYFTYSALEGMFKYLSDFSPLVYIIKPMLAALLLGAWLLSRGFAGKRIHMPPFASLILLWMGWGCVEIFFPTGAGVLGSSVTFLTWYLLPISFYFMTHDCVKTYRNVHFIITVLMLLGTVISGFALVQYGMGRDWTIAHLPGYENITQHNWWITNSSGQLQGTSWSPASTTSYPGIVCIWSNIAAIMALGSLLTPLSGLKRKIWLAACLIINIMALLVSGGRMWVILFPLEAAVLFFIALRLQPNPLHSIGLALLFVIVIGVGYIVAQNMSGGLAASRYAATASNPFEKFATDRGGNFTSLGTFIPQHPLGIGYQRGTDGGDNLKPLIAANRETEFGAMSADMGIPGLMLLMTVVFSFLWKGWRACTSLQCPRSSLAALTIFVLLCGNVISFLGTPTLQGADYFWVLSAILFTLPSMERSASTETNCSQEVGRT